MRPPGDGNPVMTHALKPNLANSRSSRSMTDRWSVMRAISSMKSKAARPGSKTSSLISRRLTQAVLLRHRAACFPLDHCLEQIGDPAPRFRIRNSRQRARDPHSLGRAQHHRHVIETFIEARRIIVGRIVLEEIRDLYRQNARNATETPGADAIGTFFIFLNLLKCHPERRAEALLRKASAKPRCPNPQTHMGIDEVGFLGHGAPSATGKLPLVQTEVVTSRRPRQGPRRRFSRSARLRL